MFANKYLDKNNRKALINTEPSTLLGIIIVIPCFQEPDILSTLDSLLQCQLPKSDTEVIVIINHSEISKKEDKLFNYSTKLKIESWIKLNRIGKIRFYVIGPVEFPKKWAGAGLARKAGMDEAALRFNLLEKPNGIIVSLDADTLVAKTYLVETEKYFYENPKHVGATILFQHQSDGLNARHKEGIRLYEQYMSYYKKALEFTGYPYPMFTVGSAFAVTAVAYVRRGGMNRRQAGEDFYFLQNLAQQGTVGEIQTTKVFPSARLSNRVPFGTGPILQKWMNGEEDLTITYNFHAFEDLKQFFAIKEKFYKAEKNSFNELMKALPKSVKQFVDTDNFWSELEDLNQNCSTLSSFQSRYFQKFNAFKILKYLNFVHEGIYKKENLAEQLQLLEMNAKKMAT